MKKLILLLIIPLAILIADMNFPTSTQKGDSMSIVGAEETAPPVIKPTLPPETTAPVNTSGIIPNSLDLVWKDMTTAAEVAPVCTSASFSRGPNWKAGKTTTPWGNGGPPGVLARCKDWRKVNVWIEVEEDAGPPVQWCKPTINKAQNTQVEVSGLTGYWLDYDGKWHKLWDNYKNLAGGKWPKKKMNYPATRGCTEKVWQKYENIRQAYPGYDPVRGHTSDGNLLIRPAHYWRTHIWTSGAITVPELWDDKGGKRTPPGQMKAYYASSWARLILVDPKGVDDRHMARYIWHVSGDARQENSTSACFSDIGGISKYKLVPQNGDWAPVNMLVGDITEQEFRQNPPPFSTSPY